MGSRLSAVANLRIDPIVCGCMLLAGSLWSRFSSGVSIAERSTTF